MRTALVPVQTRLAMLATLVLLAIPVAVAPPAWAHADILGTTPEDGAVLAEVPKEITLSFGEELLPESVQVSVGDGTGLVVRVAQPVVEGSEVTVTTPPGLTPPDFTVNYRVVSQDGHPVEGTFAFTAGTAPASTGPASSEPASAGPASVAPDASSAAASAPAASAPAASTTTSTTSSESSSSLAPILAISVGLAVGIAIGALFIWRRRGAARP